jgi:hypothetical protein
MNGGEGSTKEGTSGAAGRTVANPDLAPHIARCDGEGFPRAS